MTHTRSTSETGFVSVIAEAGDAPLGAWTSTWLLLDNSIAKTSPSHFVSTYLPRECRFLWLGSPGFIRTNCQLSNCCSGRRITAQSDVPLILQGPTLQDTPGSSLNDRDLGVHLCLCFDQTKRSLQLHCHAWHSLVSVLAFLDRLDSRNKAETGW